MDRRLRFGCVVRAPATSRRDWRERVRRIDGSGFDTLLVPDHVGCWPPFPSLAAAAEVSDRLRFGTQVLNIEFWNPLLVARDVAALDVLTSGRFELGLGAGHAEDEFHAAGLRYPSPAERVGHLEAFVPLVQRLLAGEEVTVSDGPYPLRRGATKLATAQEHIPVMVGGNGDRVLAIAARHADIVGFVGFTSGTGQRHAHLSHFGWAGLADRVGHVGTVAGERFEDLELSVLVQTVVVTSDRAGTAARLATGFGQPVEALLDSPFVMVGSEGQLAAQVERLRDERGVTYVTVFEDSAGALAPVIARLR